MQAFCWTSEFVIAVGQVDIVLAWWIFKKVGKTFGEDIKFGRKIEKIAV